MSSFAIFFGKVLAPLLIKGTELACMVATLAVALLALRRGKRIHPGWIAAAISAELLARFIYSMVNISSGRYPSAVMLPMGIYQTFLMRPMPWIILGLGVWRACRRAED